MSPADEIRELYAYNRWANARMLDAVAPLSHVEYARDVGGSFGSVRDTLAHMLGAEWVWLSRWQGSSPMGFPKWDTSSLALLRERWRQVEADQTAYVETLRDEDLVGTVTYRNTAGTEFGNELRHLLRHVANHATYHRGQVTSMLRALGHEPVATDMIVWHREGAPGA